MATAPDIDLRLRFTLIVDPTTSLPPVTLLDGFQLPRSEPYIEVDVVYWPKLKFQSPRLGPVTERARTGRDDRCLVPVRREYPVDV